MLLCDYCEDGLLVICCHPRAARIPIGEWLCISCLKKKHKLQNKSSNSLTTTIEIGRNGNSTIEGELGSLEFMFRDIEPYMSNVRIGSEFQASVPDWTGPIYENEFDLVGVSIETGPSTSDYSLERNSNNSFNLKSIGNWLQCQGTIDGIREDVDETICGKWRSYVSRNEFPVFAKEDFEEWRFGMKLHFCALDEDMCEVLTSGPYKVMKVNTVAQNGATDANGNVTAVPQYIEKPILEWTA